MTIAQITTENELNEVRALFSEYVASLGVDLSFQHFDEELAGKVKMATGIGHFVASAQRR